MVLAADTILPTVPKRTAPTMANPVLDAPAASSATAETDAASCTASMACTAAATTETATTMPGDAHANGQRDWAPEAPHLLQLWAVWTPSSTMPPTSDVADHALTTSSSYES